MTAKEARALNLAYLVKIKANNNQRLFAETFGFNSSHISQMINAPLMGDAVARKIEKTFKLPRGAMDSRLEGKDEMPPGAEETAQGPLYAELGLYWLRLPFPMQQALLELARTSVMIDRRGTDGAGDHPRRRATDQQLPHGPFADPTKRSTQ